MRHFNEINMKNIIDDPVIEESKFSIDNNITDGIPESAKNNNPCDNGPWNYKILLLLRKIGKKTMGYRWMHEQDTQYYNK